MSIWAIARRCTYLLAVVLWAGVILVSTVGVEWVSAGLHRLLLCAAVTVGAPSVLLISLPQALADAFTRGYRTAMSDAFEVERSRMAGRPGLHVVEPRKVTHGE